MSRVLRAWASRLRHGRHPDQYRYLSRESLVWVWRHRAYGPTYLVRYARLARLRLLHPDVVTRGMVFLGRGVRVETIPGYGVLELGAFVHVGDGSVLSAHEGRLRVGDKAVLGSDVRVVCWLDVEIGPATLVADWCYVADFDHVHDDVHRLIKDQGIRKTPVRIGAGSWLGLRSTVLRGSVLGEGTVVAAHAVVRGVFGDALVLAGAPAVAVADRAERQRLRAAASRRPAGRGAAAGVTGGGPVAGEGHATPDGPSARRRGARSS